MDSSVQEFFVEAGSKSGHCCFDWTIMVKKKDGTEESFWVESFDKEQAILICNALNEYKERHY